MNCAYQLGSPHRFETDYLDSLPACPTSGFVIMTTDELDYLINSNSSDPVISGESFAWLILIIAAGSILLGRF